MMLDPKLDANPINAAVLLTGNESGEKSISAASRDTLSGRVELNIFHQNVPGHSENVKRSYDKILNIQLKIIVTLFHLSI